MAEAIQACERSPGQDTCPFHPGHKIFSVCKTCGILVCPECVTSKEHKEHEFKKISECLREPTNAIARYLTKIDKNLLVAVNQDLDAVKSERKESVQKHTDRIQSIEEQATIFKREIDSSTNDMVVQMGKHLQEVLDSLDQHTEVLESLRNYFLNERKDFTKVLHDGSAILKFDVGSAVMDIADETKVPEHPYFSDLQHIKSREAAELIKKALGTLQELNHPDLSPPTIVQRPPGDSQKELATTDHSVLTPEEDNTAHEYSSFTTKSTWSNVDTQYRQISPVTNDTAWAGSYNKRNLLQLIDSTGKSLQSSEIVRDFRSLSVHPTTGKLYTSFLDDKTIRTIDTESGTTSKIVVQCDIKPGIIKVTNDNDILVADWKDECQVYRYKLTGQLVQQSPKKYKPFDMDQCSRTKRVMVACNDDGVSILNNNLSNIHTITRLARGFSVFKKKFECTAAIFDSHSNLIVGDFVNKKVYILDGNLYTMIQKVPMKDLSNPLRLRLHNDMLWLACQDPRKVMYIEMK